MQQATQKDTKKPKATYQHCKNPGHYRNSAVNSNEKKQSRNNTDSSDNSNNKIRQTISKSNNKISNITNINDTNNEKTRRPRPVYPPCETCGETKGSTEKCYCSPKEVQFRRASRPMRLTALASRTASNGQRCLPGSH